MKVKEFIKLLENEGWRLIGPKAAIGSSNMNSNAEPLRFPARKV